MVTLYKKQNFRICGLTEDDHSKSEYIIINVKKPFQEGHSHINDFRLAKRIIDMACTERIPAINSKPFVLDTLIRISSGPYVTRLKQVKNNTRIRRSRH